MFLHIFANRFLTCFISLLWAIPTHGDQNSLVHTKHPALQINVYSYSQHIENSLLHF